MGYKDRTRRKGRGPAKLQPKPRILIITEGEKTEKQYIEGYKRACKNPRVAIEYGRGGAVPLTLVQRAKTRKQETDRQARQERDENLKFEEVWCVFDRDEHPNFDQAIEEARHSSIRLAISNPCFELWLLLHFNDAPGLQHRDKITEKLCSCVTGYNKSINYSVYAPGNKDASRRARQLDKQAELVGEAYRNPTTGMWQLVESIRK